MSRMARFLVASAIVVGAACSDSSSPNADPISGNWSGKFDNGIPITVVLALSGSAISGTYKAGADSGTVSGTYTASSFTFQFTALFGTQRTLSAPQLINGNTRITANWDDGAGLNGAMCLAKSGSTACP